MTATTRPVIQCVGGAAIDAYLDDLARLRIAVFREFPYLYDGTAAMNQCTFALTRHRRKA